MGAGEADGAFDLQGIGKGDGLQWPGHLGPDQLVVVDELTAPVSDHARRGTGKAVFTLSGADDGHLPDARSLRLVPQPDAVDEPEVEVHVAVNRLAQRHRHHGFGFTGYQLVLSDRSGRHDDPPPAAAWISGAFDDDDVVVVEDAVASAWKGRVLRGMVPVDTRMDLWRLVAHANVCVDLAPGRQIARECVEALRFGTPIVVPADAGPAVAHAAAGGGETFADPGELVSAVARLRTRPTGPPPLRRGGATPTRTTATRGELSPACESSWRVSDSVRAGRDCDSRAPNGTSGQPPQRVVLHQQKIGLWSGSLRHESPPRLHVPDYRRRTLPPGPRCRRRG